MLLLWWMDCVSIHAEEIFCSFDCSPLYFCFFCWILQTSDIAVEKSTYHLNIINCILNLNSRFFASNKFYWFISENNTLVRTIIALITNYDKSNKQQLLSPTYASNVKLNLKTLKLKILLQDFEKCCNIQMDVNAIHFSLKTV